jgi:hypothetical protein
MHYPPGGMKRLQVRSVCELRREPAMRCWVAQPPSRRIGMSQPLQAESPALVWNIEDDDAELVGRFHYVALVRNRPRTLGTWRVTTESPRTAERIAQVLGGHVQEEPTGDLAAILTTSSTINILLTGSNALHIGWQRDDRNTCDGVTQDDCRVCICPADFEPRRAAAKQGRGCRPRAEVRFRLLDDQTVGVLGLVSHDWPFVELISTAQAVLTSWEGRGPVRAQLGLRRSLHTLPSGMVLPCDHTPWEPSSSSPVSEVIGT